MTEHGPGEPEQIAHPGGKNGWWRVRCVGTGCDYEATEAIPARAARRVNDHARDKRPPENP